MRTRADLIAFLDARRISHRTVDHPAVFRVGEGEDIKAGLPGVHTKNLFLKDAKGRPWLISAADRTVVDLKRLAPVIGAARLSFGPEALMAATLGVTPGSVTALGLINDQDRQVSFVLDRVLAEADVVNFHPLTNTATSGLTQAGFRTFLSALGVVPLVVDFETLQIIQLQSIR